MFLNASPATAFFQHPQYRGPVGSRRVLAGEAKASPPRRQGDKGRKEGKQGLRTFPLRTSAPGAGGEGFASNPGVAGGAIVGDVQAPGRRGRGRSVRRLPAGFRCSATLAVKAMGWWLAGWSAWFVADCVEQALDDASRRCRPGVDQHDGEFLAACSPDRAAPVARIGSPSCRHPADSAAGRRRAGARRAASGAVGRVFTTRWRSRRRRRASLSMRAVAR